MGLFPVARCTRNHRFEVRPTATESTEKERQLGASGLLGGWPSTRTLKRIHGGVGPTDAVDCP